MPGATLYSRSVASVTVPAPPPSIVPLPLALMLNTVASPAGNVVFWTIRCPASVLLNVQVTVSPGWTRKLAGMPVYGGQAGARRKSAAAAHVEGEGAVSVGRALLQDDIALLAIGKRADDIVILGDRYGVVRDGDGGSPVAAGQRRIVVRHGGF